MIFRILSALLLLGILILWIKRALLRRRTDAPSSAGQPAKPNGQDPLERKPRGSSLAYLFLGVGSLILALTGFGSIWVNGIGGMAGVALILHNAGAPLFLLGLVLVSALEWAEAMAVRKSKAEGRGGGRGSPFFWAVALSGFLAAFSVAMAMSRVSGAEEIALWAWLHRLSGLLFTACWGLWLAQKR